MKYSTIRLITALTAFLTPYIAKADDPLKIAATLSSYADIARSIGGTHVDVSSVASPKFNPHFIEPRPSDVLKVKRAALFIHSGLDLEAWRDPLLNAAGRADFRAGGAAQLDLSAGVRILQIPDHPLSRSEGDIHLYGNPHYWTDPRNGLIIAREIAAKLSDLDPANASDYRKNLDDFSAALSAKIAAWQTAAKPFAGTEFIGYHNEWAYLMDFLDMKMERFLEPKPGIPPSPQQIELITEYIKSKKIPGIIEASFSSRDAGDAVAERSGAKVLVLAQSVGEIDDAKDYVSLIDYDVSQILEALKARMEVPVR